MLENKRRNRKRSKRRAIFCSIHSCYMDSVSQKHRLYADKSEHLRNPCLIHLLSNRMRGKAANRRIQAMQMVLRSIWRTKRYQVLLARAAP